MQKSPFWKELELTFPPFVKDFDDWFLEYQDKTHWGVEIGSHVTFYSLPNSMQVGIVFLFFRDKYHYRDLTVYDVTDQNELFQLFKDCFARRFVEKEVEADLNSRNE